jgi:hypothetical protein
MNDLPVPMTEHLATSSCEGWQKKFFIPINVVEQLSKTYQFGPKSVQNAEAYSIYKDLKPVQ